MYKGLGKGGVTLHSTRYAEEVMLDKEANYKLGFDIVLIPTIRLKNNISTIALYVNWLCFEFCAFWFKSYRVEIDVQGQKRTIHQGVRYRIARLLHLSGRDLFDR